MSFIDQIKGAAGVIVLPVVMYVVAFSYAVGYSAGFGFPFELIQINVNYVLSTVISYCVIIFFSFGFFQLVMQSWPRSGRWPAAFVFYYILYLMVTLFCKLALPIKYYYISAVFVVFPFAIGANLLFARYRRRVAQNGINEENQKELVFDVKKTFTVFDARSDVPADSLGHAVITHLRFDPLAVMLIVAIILPIFVAGLGAAEAVRKTSYFIFVDENKTERIALLINGSDVISAPFDRDSSAFRREFVVNASTDIKSGLSPINLQKLSSLPPR